MIEKQEVCSVCNLHRNRMYTDNYGKLFCYPCLAAIIASYGHGVCSNCGNAFDKYDKGKDGSLFVTDWAGVICVECASMMPYSVARGVYMTGRLGKVHPNIFERAIKWLKNFVQGLVSLR